MHKSNYYLIKYKLDPNLDRPNVCAPQVPPTSTILWSHQITLLLVQNIEDLLKLFTPHYFIFILHFLTYCFKLRSILKFIVTRTFLCHPHKSSCFIYQSPRRPTSTKTRKHLFIVYMFVSVGLHRPTFMVAIRNIKPTQTISQLSRTQTLTLFNQAYNIFIIVGIIILLECCT